MKNALIALVLTFGILGTCFGVIEHEKAQTTQQPTVGTAANDLSIKGAQTAGSVSVATSDTLISATSTSRAYDYLCNDGTNAIYLNFGNIAVVNKGIRVGGGTCYEIAGGNRFTGAIHGVAATGATVMTWIETSGNLGTYGN